MYHIGTSIFEQKGDKSIDTMNEEKYDGNAYGNKDNDTATHYDRSINQS